MRARAYSTRSMVFRLLPRRVDRSSMPSLRAEQNREIYCIEGVVRPRKRGKCRPQQSHRLGQMRREIEELRARNADLEATHLLPEPNMLQDLRSSLCLTAGLDRFLATLGESSSTMLFLVAGKNDLACLIMKSMKTEFIVSKEHASKKTQNYKCIRAMKTLLFMHSTYSLKRATLIMYVHHFESGGYIPCLLKDAPAERSKALQVKVPIT